MFNRSKRNQVRSRVVTRDNTAGVSVLEHFVSARVKPPKDFRLSDDWLRYVMKALLLLSPDASRKSAILRRILRWSTEGVHRATDVERVECSADLLEVKGAKMSSKSSPWITGRDALELLTSARSASSIMESEPNG